MAKKNHRYVLVGIQDGQIVPKWTGSKAVLERDAQLVNTVFPDRPVRAEVWPVEKLQETFGPRP